MNDQASVWAPRSDVKKTVVSRVAKALTRAVDGHTR
jgi:hypothetical protein